MLNSKLLLVDDEEKILVVLEALLQDEVGELFSAKNGEDALEIVKNNDIDVVVTDINMPKMNGIELLRQVREYDSSIQVIIVTAFADKENAIEAVKYGAFDFFEKPIDSKNVTETVRKAVEERKCAIDYKRVTKTEISCHCCGRKWKSLSSFLFDKNISYDGYQVSPNDPLDGVFLFYDDKSDCNTSLSRKLGDLAIYTGLEDKLKMANPENDCKPCVDSGYESFNSCEKVDCRGNIIKSINNIINGYIRLRNKDIK